VEAIFIQAAVPIRPCQDPPALTPITEIEILSFAGHEFIFLAKSAIFSVLLLI
jgi:hypothetical protein